MNKIIYLFITLLFLVGCSANNMTNSNSNNQNEVETPDNTVTENGIITNVFGDFTISSIIKEGYSKSGQVITFTKSGDYTISGTFNGSLFFNVDTTDSVTLYLNNAKINSTLNHAIYWMNETGKIEIKAMENTINEITVLANSNGLCSAIESENNIEIGGSGKLVIKGNQRHAVKGSNIEVKGNVDLTIEAVKDGLHGKQILITGGNTKINNCTDAIQADINSNNLKGTITIEEGILEINNCKRAFKAATSILIKQLTGYTITINVNNTQTVIECLNVDYVDGTFLVDGESYS